VSPKLINSFDGFLVLIGENHPDTKGTGAAFSTSKVKIKILRALWDAGTSFPRDWVKSTYLLKVTQQKYFDRRIRELRDETGCDIETGTSGGQPAYRLCSLKLKNVQDRTYLSSSQKKHLFEKHDYHCAVCGKKIDKGVKGLEADHKIPLIRGGGSEISNWQTLCISCNVSKRRSCQGCDEDCGSCAWAFPERFGRVITIRASREILNKVREIAEKEGSHSQDLILEAISKYIKSRT
jgi:5-methylcytosine-specific restriction endonuclease McrA